MYSSMFYSIFICLTIYVIGFKVRDAQAIDLSESFKERATDKELLLQAEKLLSHLPNQEQLNGWEKALTECLSLSDADLQQFIQTELQRYPSLFGREKRSLNYLKRLQNLYDDETYYKMERRELKQQMLDHAEQFLEKLSQEDLQAIYDRFLNAVKNNDGALKKSVQALADATLACAKMKAGRRSLALRNYVDGFRAK